MDSWWDLGEWAGHRGAELDPGQITCAFCLERGKFRVVHHAEKTKPNGHKKLNFDTLECVNCKGYALVLWSGNEYPGSQPMHDFKEIPFPLRYDSYPEHWPEAVGRFWLQAKRSLHDDNWDAAAVMARSGLQAALRNHKAEGKSLKRDRQPC